MFDELTPDLITFLGLRFLHVIVLPLQQVHLLGASLDDVGDLVHIKGIILVVAFVVFVDFIALIDKCRALLGRDIPQQLHLVDPAIEHLLLRTAAGLLTPPAQLLLEVTNDVLLLAGGEIAETVDQLAQNAEHVLLLLVVAFTASAPLMRPFVHCRVQGELLDVDQLQLVGK